MKMVNARPLVTGSAYTSAYTPPTTEIGEDAPIPTRKRNTMYEAKFGATAVAKVKMV